jgi:hypothetical protein
MTGTSDASRDEFAARVPSYDAQLAVLPWATHVGVTRRPSQVLALITPFLDAGCAADTCV